MVHVRERSPADAFRHRGPPLVAVATTYVVLFFASLVASTTMAHGRHFPSVFDPADESARFFRDNPGAVQLMSFLQFGAAIPLGVFTATAASRVQFLGMKVAGIHIALFGGFVASMALVLSALLEWTLAQPGVADSASATRVLHLLAFAAGGPGFVVPFGLLVAGISLVAGLQGFVPRSLMSFGLLIAAVAELATLVFVAPALGFLLPLARFAGFAWMILVGALLPKAKVAQGARPARVLLAPEVGELGASR
jgi:hypothetical protein